LLAKCAKLDNALVPTAERFELVAKSDEHNAGWLLVGAGAEQASTSGQHRNTKHVLLLLLLLPLTQWMQCCCNKKGSSTCVLQCMVLLLGTKWRMASNLALPPRLTCSLLLKGWLVGHLPPPPPHHCQLLLPPYHPQHRALCHGSPLQQHLLLPPLPMLQSLRWVMLQTLGLESGLLLKEFRPCLHGTP
jgi:hypothetical protein